jgi:pimeloyl-ACP methyl ester carboxylesterase
MASFAFLHGAFHAAWNWYRVLPLLQSSGHQGIALDVPGHGRDETPPRKVTLNRCVDALGDAIRHLDDKVVLVAHSRNGIVISQAAERFPERIAGLVYLAAYLVPNGRSLMEYALQDSESLVVRNVAPRFTRRQVRRFIALFKRPLLRPVLPLLLPRRIQTHRLDPAVYKEALYHDCDEEIVHLANALLEAEPNWTGYTPLQLSDSRFGSVPKVYIECLEDRAVTLALQRKMLRDTPCDRVFSMSASHSPFFSQPSEFVQVLLESLALFQSDAPSARRSLANSGERPITAVATTLGLRADANRHQE